MSGLAVTARVSRLSLRPTALALPWSPVLVVAVAALATSWASGLLSDRRTALPLVLAGVLAAAAVAALHDPADELLRALPTLVLARRLLRTALVALVVGPATAMVAWLTPGPGAAAATTALVLTGLAVATWLPPHRVLAAAAVPACWTAAGVWLADILGGPAQDATTWWATHPWQVVAVAVVVVAAGRNR